jgi:hypothetical protein
MSRKCRACARQFRPSFGAQRLCWDCFRLAATEKGDTMDTATETIETAGALELYEPTPVTLFGTNDPRTALNRMSDLAKVLVDLVRAQKLSSSIRGNEYLRVEAWRALGGMVGVYPVTAWSRPNETGDGYLVRVEARTRAGEIVGASEAECSRDETTWKDRDAHALRAMAETRATSRALRGPLGQVVVLAGYEAAGAEEMPAETAVAGPEPDRGKVPSEHRPTHEQIVTIGRLLDRLAAASPDRDWRAEAQKLAGVPGDMLTATVADMLIEDLEGELALQEAKFEEAS